MMQRPVRILVIAGAALLLLLIAGRTAVALYTDALWFQGVGYASVFWTRLGVATVVRTAAAILGAGVVLLNLWVVLRHLGPVRLRRQYGNLEIAEQVPRGYLIAGIIAVSVLAGWWLSSLQFGGDAAIRIMAWLRRPEWNVSDALFGRDLSFFVFSLPVYFSLVDYVLLALAWSAVLVGVGYMLVGSVRLRDGRLEIAEHARFHFILLLAGLVFAFGVRYWLGRYGLLLEGTGVGGGLGYTDVQARLPAHHILTVLSLLTGAALVYGAFRRRWLPAIASVGVLVVAAVVVGHLYPAFIQKFRVEPNELERESPYIRWNIEYTRRAYGLDEIGRRAFPYRRQAVPDWEELQPSLGRLPLWDAEPLQTAFNQVQSIFGYYHFPRVDFDRYRTEDGLEQVAVAVREFNVFGLPEDARTWQTLRLNPSYIRGDGSVISPVSRSSGQGEPVLWLENVNPVVRHPAAPPTLDLANPHAYFGETMTGHSVLIPGRDSAFLGTPGEDFPTGVQLSSFARVLAFAWRFQDENLLFSGEVTEDSRFVFRRQLTERVRTLAPFVSWDPDPHPVVHRGRIVWMLDGYSTARTFPLARPIDVEGMGRVRYMRNSVKAVVDAVTGKVRLYVVDASEPIVEAYRRVFPDLIQPIEAMPADLRAHMRYPSLYFRLQAGVLERYHLDQPEAFYAGQDVWQLPRRRGAQGGWQPLRPMYLLLTLPGRDEPEFLLTIPFIARERQNMTALMIARNQPEDYGELRLLELPRDQQIPGPSQVESVMEQDPVISSQLSLWRQAGSDVNLGRLRVIPLDSTFLYIEPIFLSAQESAIPELQRVVVSDGRQVRMAPTLRGAIEALVSGDEDRDAERAPGRLPPSELPAVEEWPRRALDLLRDADRSLRDGNWSEFGSKWEELRSLLQELTETQ